MVKNKNESGFGAIELLLIGLVVLLLVACGAYIYNRSAKHTISPSSSSRTTGGHTTPAKVSNFYECVDQPNYKQPVADGTARPFTCTANGTTYTIPLAFSTEDIIRYDKAPVAVQPLILPLAKKNFDTYRGGCSGIDNPCPYPNTTIDIVSSSFVQITLDNWYAPTIHRFALQNGQWTELPQDDNFFMGCSNVKKYDIRASSVFDIDPSFIHQCGK